MDLSILILRSSVTFDENRFHHRLRSGPSYVNTNRPSRRRALSLSLREPREDFTTSPLAFLVGGFPRVGYIGTSRSFWAIIRRAKVKAKVRGPPVCFSARPPRLWARSTQHRRGRRHLFPYGQRTYLRARQVYRIAIYRERSLELCMKAEIAIRNGTGGFTSSRRTRPERA